jgi:hypothetical protein
MVDSGRFTYPAWLCCHSYSLLALPYTFHAHGISGFQPERPFVMGPSWTNDRLRKSPHRVLYQLNRESWRLVLVDGFNPFRGSLYHPVRSVVDRRGRKLPARSKVYGDLNPEPSLIRMISKMTIADVTVRPSGPDIDSFPSKEPSVERPCSRSEECQCRPNTCQRNIGRQISMLRQGVPQAKDDYQRPCDWRPQSSNQERAVSDH